MPEPTGDPAFRHGVASGDPTPDRVVIWTRVTQAPVDPVPVSWWLEDPGDGRAATAEANGSGRP